MKALGPSSVISLCFGVVAAQDAIRTTCTLKECFSVAAAIECDAHGRPNETKSDGDSGKVRELSKELEESENELRRLSTNHRLDEADCDKWKIDEPLQLARKAQRIGVERDLLESLLRSAAADGADKLPLSYSRFNMTQKTLTALAWLILEKNLPEVERFLRPGPGMPGPPQSRGAERVLRQWSFCPGDFFGAALAAIDSYQDDRARDYLLELAMRDRTLGRRDPIAMHAWNALLRYDPKTIRPLFERTLKAEVKAASIDAKTSRYGSKRAASLALQAGLDELEYADSLDRRVRQRYFRIGRLLSCTDALACQTARPPPHGSPAILVSFWQEGDERFLPHMLETGKVRADLMLVNAPMSRKGAAWLKEQVESCDLPARVKTDLERLLKAGWGQWVPFEDRIGPILRQGD